MFELGEADIQHPARVVVPAVYMEEISDILRRLKHAKTILDPVDKEQYLKRLAQLVDWLEACFSDEQLKAAILFLGDRAYFSPAPQYWYPRVQMTTPLGTILSPNTEN